MSQIFLKHKDDKFEINLVPQINDNVSGLSKNIRHAAQNLGVSQCQPSLLHLEVF